MAGLLRTISLNIALNGCPHSASCPERDYCVASIYKSTKCIEYVPDLQIVRVDDYYWVKCLLDTPTPEQADGITTSNNHHQVRTGSPKSATQTSDDLSVSRNTAKAGLELSERSDE